MRDTTLRDHLIIVGQLPDFVLGKLDETSERRVSQHLEACAICRSELTSAIDVLGALSPTPRPPARLRGAILQRAAAELPAVTRQRGALGSTGTDLSAAGIVGPSLSSARNAPRGTPYGSVVPNWALAALSAAVLLIGVLSGWRYEQLNGNGFNANDPVSGLIDESMSAYPLDDSDLPVSATGVLFAEPRGHTVYLVANGLPALPHDQRYQVWLFTTNDHRQSAGLVNVGADGELRALLETPDPFATYVGVALTAEPSTGSDVPTTGLVLGGSLTPVIATLPSLPA